jgi:ribosomal-protein-alanine N-acetyltransferase
MLTVNFSPFPNLETERLLLRRLTINDAEEILILRGNPEIMKFIPRPLAKSIKEV